MALWIRIGTAVLAFIAVGTAAALWIGTSRWDRETARLITRLVPASALRSAAIVDFRRLEGLPRPVLRYFTHVLKDGQPVIRSARLVQAGEINTGKDADSWRPFTAVQHVSPSPPGFVWDAGIRMAPLLTAAVRDGYVDGSGSMAASPLSLIPIVDVKGTPEPNAGALQRYLAEAAWLPTALLPSQGVRWRAIDDQRAEATVTDGRTTVSLEFRFMMQERSLASPHPRASAR